MNNVLIIDDEPGIRNVLRDILLDEKYSVLDAADGILGLAIMERELVDLVILDIWMPRMGGIDVLRRIKELHPLTEVVVISGHATVDLAVKAVKLGAFDFLEKPLSLDRIVTLCRNALKLEELRRENSRLRNQLVMEDELVGAGEAMRRVRELVEQSARSDSRVLITGENGTGKELVARQIHRQSGRSAGPFVEVNCAAIPDGLIESELFGHEKGAFTGAIGRRRGRFEQAHRGSLFLDEVADMSPSAQAKVLRVIQDLRFQRVGGEESIAVDLRLIAATNRNIPAEIKAGRFREDLYFRINVIPIRMPALRERPDDLPLLLDYFFDKFRPTPEGGRRVISREGLDFLAVYPWPGNVRELKNFVERVSILSDEQTVGLDTVRYCLGEDRLAPRTDSLGAYQVMSLIEAREAFEKMFIASKFKQHAFSIASTAEALGIPASSLHAKMRKHGIRSEK